MYKAMINSLKHKSNRPVRPLLFATFLFVALLSGCNNQSVNNAPDNELPDGLELYDGGSEVDGKIILDSPIEFTLSPSKLDGEWGSTRAEGDDEDDTLDPLADNEPSPLQLNLEKAIYSLHIKGLVQGKDYTVSGLSQRGKVTEATLPDVKVTLFAMPMVDAVNDVYTLTIVANGDYSYEVKETSPDGVNENSEPVFEWSKVGDDNDILDMTTDDVKHRVVNVKANKLESSKGNETAGRKPYEAASVIELENGLPMKVVVSNLKLVKDTQTGKLALYFVSPNNSDVFSPAIEQQRGKNRVFTLRRLCAKVRIVCMYHYPENADNMSPAEWFAKAKEGNAVLIDPYLNLFFSGVQLIQVPKHFSFFGIDDLFDNYYSTNPEEKMFTESPEVMNFLLDSKYFDPGTLNWSQEGQKKRDDFVQSYKMEWTHQYALYTDFYIPANNERYDLSTPENQLGVRVMYRAVESPGRALGDYIIRLGEYDKGNANNPVRRNYIKNNTRYDFFVRFKKSDNPQVPLVVASYVQGRSDVFEIELP